MKTYICQLCEKIFTREDYRSAFFCSRDCSNKEKSLRYFKKNEEKLKDMANLYNQGLTYQQIGDIYGVTRERIRQSLKLAIKYNLKVLKLRQAKGNPCIDCGEIILKNPNSYGRCSKCNWRIKNPNKIRRYERPTNCISCNEAFNEKVKYDCKGFCEKCYRFWRYHLLDRVKKSQKLSQIKYNLKHKKEIYLRNAEYARKNRAKINARKKQWKIERKEKIFNL